MVTKQWFETIKDQLSLILAKIHMVTKLILVLFYINDCLILAKIHMVTKHS